jgi:hypothetical protein
MLDQSLITQVHDTLAWLVAAGYFDLILTTNWDQAIETSLGRFLDRKDFRTYIRPEIDPKATAQAMYQHIKETGDLLMKELQEELPDSGNFNSRWFEGIATPN